MVIITIGLKLLSNPKKILAWAKIKKGLREAVKNVLADFVR